MIPESGPNGKEQFIQGRLIAVGLAAGATPFNYNFIVQKANLMPRGILYQLNLKVEQKLSRRCLVAELTLTSPTEESALAILRICCFCSSICLLSSSILVRSVLEAGGASAAVGALLLLLDDPGL